MNIELKPCPFCGGKARIRKWKRERILTHLKETKKGTKTPAWVRIEE